MLSVFTVVPMFPTFRAKHDAPDIKDGYRLFHILAPMDSLVFILLLLTGRFFASCMVVSLAGFAVSVSRAPRPSAGAINLDLFLVHFRSPSKFAV